MRRYIGKKGWRKAWKLTLCMILTVASLCSCSFSLPDLFNQAERGQAQGGSQAETGSEKPADTGLVVPGPESFDSADTAVVVEIDRKEKAVTFLNLALGKRYTLSVEGTSTLYDKYGESISLDQVEPGDIVDITFLKTRKRLNSLQLSYDAWVHEEISRYEIENNQMYIGSNTYKLTDNTLFYSNGRLIERMDLNSADILTVRGLDSSVLSVQVDKGHGYLRLANDENFIGGWIEVGQARIQQITEDMLLTVPEGSYQVLISHNGGGGVKDVIINRNEEVTLDIGDLEVAETKYGSVIFSLSPSGTKLYVDGEAVDTSAPVSLEYGIHQIIARADGYKTLTTYIKVGQESGGIDVTLDSLGTNEDGQDEKESESTQTGSTDVTSGYYKVHVDAPEGAEVYLDGNYVGISPCSFRKEAGAHIITLRRTGYETRSYTVQIDEEEKDITYSFADLVPSGTSE